MWQVPGPPTPPVVALTRATGDDPAASTARTTKWYVVDGARPVLLCAGVVSPVATWVVLDGVKFAVVLRCTVYVIVQFAGGVTAFHATLIWLDELALATRLVTAAAALLHVPPPGGVVAWARAMGEAPAPSTTSTM